MTSLDRGLVRLRHHTMSEGLEVDADGVYRARREKIPGVDVFVSVAPMVGVAIVTRWLFGMSWPAVLSASGITLILFGALSVLRLSRRVTAAHDLIIDRNQKLVIARTGWFGPRRAARFDQIERVVAEHFMNGRSCELSFLCKPDHELVPAPRIPLPPRTDWRRAWEVGITEDCIAAWIGCPIEHDYSHD